MQWQQNEVGLNRNMEKEKPITQIEEQILEVDVNAERNYPKEQKRGNEG